MGDVHLSRRPVDIDTVRGERRVRAPILALGVRLVEDDADGDATVLRLDQVVDGGGVLQLVHDQVEGVVGNR